MQNTAIMKAKIQAMTNPNDLNSIFVAINYPVKKDKPIK